MLVLEEAVEAGPRKEPMESSKKLLLLPLTLALLVGCILLDNGLLEEKDKIILSARIECLLIHSEKTTKFEKKISQAYLA